MWGEKRSLWDTKKHHKCNKTPARWCKAGVSGGRKGEPPSLHSFVFQLHPLSSKNCHLIISSVLNAIYAHTSLERGPCSGLKRI